jgi:glycosyltransferase involved in cell wall biosynthesis
MENTLMKKVSVLIPVHGDGQFLTESLDSIYNQEFSEVYTYDVIVVLDRVSDDVRKILDNYKKNDFLVIESPSDGIVAALNAGIDSAKGEFIARLDADDQMLPNRLIKQVEYLISHENVLVVGSQVNLIDSKGNYISESRYETDPSDIRRLMKVSCQISHPTTMYRKSALIEIKGYRDFYRNAEDYDLWVRLLRLGDIAILDEPLLNYRIHENQISVTKAREQFFATYAVRRSERRVSRGKPDLSDEFSNIDAWLNHRSSLIARISVAISNFFWKVRKEKSKYFFLISPLYVLLYPKLFWLRCLLFLKNLGVLKRES